MISIEEENELILTNILASLGKMDEREIGFLVRRAAKGDSEATVNALKNFLIVAKLNYADELAEFVAGEVSRDKFQQELAMTRMDLYHDKRQMVIRDRLYWAERWCPPSEFVDALIASGIATIKPSFSFTKMKQGYKLVGYLEQGRPSYMRRAIESLSNAQLTELSTAKLQ